MKNTNHPAIRPRIHPGARNEIKAHIIREGFTMQEHADTYTVTASALSYAYTSVKSGTEARRDLGKALYLYSQAADAMFGN